MAQQRSSEYIAATMNGAQSVLEGIFNPAVAYDDIRMRIMRPLNNEDANNMRLTSSRMDYGVTVPLAGAGRRELRFQRDQLDECDEDWLPMPPALPLQGTCPNTPQSDDRIFPCRSSRYRDLRGLAPHGPTEHLVCSGCRDNGHHNILPLGPKFESAISAIENNVLNIHRARTAARATGIATSDDGCVGDVIRRIG
ncbi:hypothetical protein MMC28_002525 [Mycoblastus sanguinarius]|nr:hypothetical protein [Mycoblastus sanguinarius]